MRRQTSNGHRLAVSCPIHKNKTCSFRSGQDISNDMLGLKIDWKMTPQCPFKSTGPWNASYAHFWASLFRRDDHENDHRSSCRCISKYSQSSPRVRQSSPLVRKSLVHCKEKTLRDKVGVNVILDTRANCIAKIRAPKSWKKAFKLSSEDKAPKTWKFRHLSLYAKGARVNHCVRNGHCWSRKAFTRQMPPQIREKNCENGRFSTALTCMKSCTVDRGCTPAPKDTTKLAVFFRFFRVFPLTFQ